MAENKFDTVLQYLSLEGEIKQTLPAFAASGDFIKKLYAFMIKTRLFDQKAIALQRTGKIGTYPSCEGQEAIGIGVASAMNDSDVLCPYYRDHGAPLWRGVLMEEIFLYWGGDERGSNFKNARQDFPICVPIASQTLHAAGIAKAMQLKNEKRATVVLLGDGATSRGDFYEAMNAAGVWNLPLVFVISNNQWAISVPRHAQTKAETLAQKGIAAGIAGIQVDGNDVIAVHDAMLKALEKARSGGGPSLIEAITYRLSDHTTADDAKRYRSEVEVAEHRNKDPLIRLKHYLEKNCGFNEVEENNLRQSLQEEVMAAVSRFLSIEPMKASSLFDDHFASIPHDLAKQKQEFQDLTGE